MLTVVVMVVVAMRAVLMKVMVVMVEEIGETSSFPVCLDGA